MPCPIPAVTARSKRSQQCFLECQYYWETVNHKHIVYLELLKRITARIPQNFQDVNELKSIFFTAASTFGDLLRRSMFCGVFKQMLIYLHTICIDITVELKRKIISVNLQPMIYVFTQVCLINEHVKDAKLPSLVVRSSQH